MSAKSVRFTRIVEDSVRIATDGVIRNDLSITIGEEPPFAYNPHQNRNAQTSTVLSGLASEIPEGSRIYVSVFKGFGTTYRTNTWSAAVNVGGEVKIYGGGYDSGDVVAEDGYYPMGYFVIPGVFDLTLPAKIEPGRLYEMEFTFADDSTDSVTFLGADSSLHTRYSHQRQTQLKEVTIDYAE